MNTHIQILGQIKLGESDYYLLSLSTQKQTSSYFHLVRQSLTMNQDVFVEFDEFVPTLHFTSCFLLYRMCYVLPAHAVALSCYDFVHDGKKTTQSFLQPPSSLLAIFLS